MGLTDWIAMGVILIIVSLAVWYLVRAKKRGVKCIGCPSDCHCSKSGEKGGSCGGSCSSCTSCGNHHANDTDLK